MMMILEMNKYIRTRVFPILLTITIVISLTTNLAISQDILSVQRIKTSGALVSEKYAGKMNVYQLISGDRSLYYEITQVYEKNGRSLLRRLPFQRIHVMGSDEQFEQLLKSKTCEQIQLSMTLYTYSASAAFLELGRRDENQWMESDPDIRSCR